MHPELPGAASVNWPHLVDGFRPLQPSAPVHTIVGGGLRSQLPILIQGLEVCGDVGPTQLELGHVLILARANVEPEVAGCLSGFRDCISGGESGRPGRRGLGALCWRADL